MYHVHVLYWLVHVHVLSHLHRKFTMLQILLLYKQGKIIQRTLQLHIATKCFCVAVYKFKVISFLICLKHLILQAQQIITIGRTNNMNRSHVFGTSQNSLDTNARLIVFLLKRRNIHSICLWRRTQQTKHQISCPIKAMSFSIQNKFQLWNAS